MASIDFDAVRSTTMAVRAAIPQLHVEPFYGAKSVFPAIWCERASIAIAEVLASHGLGQWTFVTAGDAADHSGHAWLELRQEEQLVYTIDITLDQFDQWDEPFIGAGPTPALSLFTTPRFAGPWREWTVVSYDHTFAPYAAVMVEHFRPH